MTLDVDTRHVERALRLLHDPEHTYEVRAIARTNYGRGEEILSGYFCGDATDAVRRADTKDVVSWYVTLNPVDSALRARRADRIGKVGKDSTTKDQHIARRRRLLIDVDPARPSGISSSDEEHAAALGLAWEIAGWLDSLGWPEPLFADSGNGAHLVYGIDEPAEDGGLVERVLAALAKRWNAGPLKVDTGNFNPSRITKLYGTPARKGDSIPERPHRVSRLLYAPDRLDAVTTEQLEVLAGPIDDQRAAPAQSPASPTKATGRKIELGKWLADRGYAVTESPYSGKRENGTCYTFDACPADPDHSRGEAVAIQFASGGINVSCRHESCVLSWEWLKEQHPQQRSRRNPDAQQAVKQAAGYVAEHASHPDGALLRRWRGDFYRWSTERGHYAPLSDDQIKADLYRKLGLGKRSDVGEVKDALIAVDEVLIDEAELGTWLDGRPDDHAPLDLAPCRNGILYLPDRSIIPATPRYFATTALGVSFDPAAKPPKAWNEFLRQLWPTDDESIALLQEWIGYLLTPDTRQQKILLLLGPKRSGKGTIARVIAALLGAASVASPTLASLGTNFGLWPLIGKTAAVIGDARLGGRSDIAQVVERLLSISGEDFQTIDRKHREPWTGKLSTRITIISNEPPRFTDASDALACRMLVLELSQSFYGKEDTTLTDKLTAELPGILRWAIDGWKRLRGRGRFEQPASSAGAIDDLIDLASPVAAWARQTCRTDEPDQQWWLACTDAYERFKGWCEGQGIKLVATQAVFGRDVTTATGCKRVQVTRGDRRVGAYRGLALR